jgi:hypothetical protein
MIPFSGARGPHQIAENIGVQPGAILEAHGAAAGRPPTRSTRAASKEKRNGGGFTHAPVGNSRFISKEGYPKSAGASKIGFSADRIIGTEPAFSLLCDTLEIKWARRSAACAALRPITVDAHLPAHEMDEYTIASSPMKVTDGADSKSV